MPPPLLPDPPPAMNLGPIFSPDPGQDVQIDIDLDNDSARVVFFFARGQTAFLPGHKQGTDILASILGADGAESEWYASCDSTGSDAVNFNVGRSRLTSVELGLFDSGVNFRTKWPVFNFGEKFGKDPISVSKFPPDMGVKATGDNTDADFNRHVVVYAWPDLDRRFGMWMDEPHRLFGILHPELMSVMVPVQVIK
jgi:hypothetical protein